MTLYCAHALTLVYGRATAFQPRKLIPSELESSVLIKSGSRVCVILKTQRKELERQKSKG